MRVALSGTYTFSVTGVNAVVNTELDSLDLSRAGALRIETFLTGKGTADAGDLLDIYFQEAADDDTPTWDDRVHLGDPADTNTFNGSLTVSAAAPEYRANQITCIGMQLSAGDQSYEPSGSAGATHIAVGEVKDGVLKGHRVGSGTIGLQARHRLRFESTDADGDATWAGYVKLYAVTPF